MSASLSTQKAPERDAVGFAGGQESPRLRGSQETLTVLEHHLYRGSIIGTLYLVLCPDYDREFAGQWRT